MRDLLSNQGIEPLLSTVKRFSRWKDRKKEIEAPLFFDYSFLRFPTQGKLPVQKVSGVIKIVGSGSHPGAIPGEKIDTLKTLKMSVLPYDLHSYLHAGKAVEAVRKPLLGVREVLLRKGKRYRVVLGVCLIQQATAVEIDTRDILAI